MAVASEVKYEVHVSDGGRWTVYTDAATKGRAIQQAQQLLGTGKFDAAKVTEDRGQTQEILVWKEERQRVEKPETVVPITDAPVCASLGDFYKFEARIAAGRLLREYLDNRSITVLEMMHDYVLMRELTRKEDFFFQAVRTAAAILARKSDKKPVEMVEFIERIVGQIQSRAEEPGDVDLDNALQNGLDRLAQEVSRHPPDERPVKMRATVARRLRRWRDWEGKLAEMLDLADKPSSPENFSYVDEAIAEILDGSAAVQELLGYQRNLAAAIQLLVKVSGGTYKLSADSNTPLERLSALMASRPMPRTQGGITERICRSLAATTPLTKGERSDEQEAFRALVQQMIGSTMFVNSGPLCEAATLRAKSVLRHEHADESSEKAIDDMTGLLPTGSAKLGYLMDLQATDFGKKAQEHIVKALAGVLASVTTVAQLFDPGSSSEQVVRAAAGLRDRLLATSMPDEWRQRFAKRIYELLVTYSTQGMGKTAAPAPAAAPAAAAAPKPAAAQPAKGNGDDHRLNVAAGGYVFMEGEVGDRAFIVASGTIDILKRAGDRDIVIGAVGAGEIIGEMAIIDSAPRMASARASTDAVLTVISRDELSKRLDRLEKFDPVMRRLMGMFVQRMRDFRFISADS